MSGKMWRVGLINYIKFTYISQLKLSAYETSNYFIINFNYDIFIFMYQKNESRSGNYKWKGADN